MNTTTEKRPRRKARKPADRNLHLVGDTWYFRRTTKLRDGRTVRESFSLKTRDLNEARARRNAHEALPVETVIETRALAAVGDTVEAASVAFLENRERHGARPATLRSYKTFTGIFSTAFPASRWQSLSGEEFDRFLRTKYADPESAATAARHIRAFLNWSSLEKRLRNPNLLSYRFKRPLTDTAVDFLTIDECAALLNHATPDAKPALALGLFAGIRPDEIARLDWRAIRFDERRIRIDAAVSKTRAPRNIEGLPDALWRHLEPCRRESGPIGTNTRKALEESRRVAGLTRWPHDALRHTFATYYCAQSGNPGIVAHALGHANLGMLTRHYNGVATKAEAAAFFAL